jgi:hypothetical protein
MVFGGIFTQSSSSFLAPRTQFQGAKFLVRIESQRMWAVTLFGQRMGHTCQQAGNVRAAMTIISTVVSLQMFSQG